MTAATAARMGVDFETFQKHAAAEIPVRRAAARRTSRTPSRSWSARARGFVSGQVIYVAGGPGGLTPGDAPRRGATAAAVAGRGVRPAAGRVRQSQSRPSTGSTSGM